MMVQWFELTEQVGTQDEVHTELVTHIYNGGIIDPDVIKQNYKIISRDDFKCSNSPWIDAPVIVPTNRERLSITDMAAHRFARAHNTVVIRWLSKQSEWIQKPEGQDAVTAEYQDPVFWEYFIAGAKGFITENINKPLGLVNGRTCKYSSLFLSNEMDLTNFRTWLHNKAKSGDVYDLLEPPTAVNITLELDVSVWNSTKIHALTPLSIEPVRLVENGTLAFITIPMLPQSTHNPWKKAKPVPVRGSKTFPASKVSIQHHFPIEMGFAITVHKSEG